MSDAVQRQHRVADYITVPLVTDWSLLMNKHVINGLHRWAINNLNLMP